MLRLISWLALLAALSRPPDMEGKATYYSDYYHGRLTRNEEVFEQGKLTAAVDDGMWPELRDKSLLVCADSKCVVVRANDTGYLAEHGIVVDVSKRGFQELAPLRQGVVRVRVWVIEEARDDSRVYRRAILG